MNTEVLARKIEALEAKVASLTTSLAEYTTAALTSPAGDKDQAHVGGGDADRQRPVRRMSPWGLASRYLPDVFIGLVKAAGDAFGGMVFGVSTDKYGPQDLEEGETSLYSSVDGVRVYLDKDGLIHIDSADGKDVVVNGGNLKVARVTDPVNIGYLAGSVLVPTGEGGHTLVEVDFTFTPMDADGNPPAGLSVRLAGVISSDGGAEFFKG